jgi:hypothetical protein
MRFVFLGLLVVCGLAGLTARAEACACCDATTTVQPLGWTAPGGALLLRYQSDVACEQVDLLMVWHAGADAPAGCYDMRVDPDKRIECDYFSYASPGAARRPSKISSHFSRPPSELPRGDVRVRRARRGAAEDDPSWTVEVRVAGAWHRVWHGSLSSATEDRPSVSVWPNPRGDRAMLLLGYTTVGNGNGLVDTAWISLPASQIAPLGAPLSAPRQD